MVLISHVENPPCNSSRTKGYRFTWCFFREMTKEDESLGKANYHSLLDRMRNLVHLHEAQFVCSLKEEDGAYVQNQSGLSFTCIDSKNEKAGIRQCVIQFWRNGILWLQQNSFVSKALRFEIQVITLDFTWFTTLDVVKCEDGELHQCRIACRAPNHRYWCTLVELTITFTTSYTLLFRFKVKNCRVRFRFANWLYFYYFLHGRRPSWCFLKAHLSCCEIIHY